MDDDDVAHLVDAAFQQLWDRGVAPAPGDPREAPPVVALVGFDDPDDVAPAALEARFPAALRDHLTRPGWIDRIALLDVALVAAGLDAARESTAAERWAALADPSRRRLAAARLRELGIAHVDWFLLGTLRPDPVGSALELRALPAGDRAAADQPCGIGRVRRHRSLL